MTPGGRTAWGTLVKALTLPRPANYPYCQTSLIFIAKAQGNFGFVILNAFPTVSVWHVGIFVTSAFTISAKPMSFVPPGKEKGKRDFC